MMVHLSFFWGISCSLDFSAATFNHLLTTTFEGYAGGCIVFAKSGEQTRVEEGGGETSPRGFNPNKI